MYDLIAILCVISGAYMAYAAIVMKYKGQFIKNVVLSNGADENSINDKEGFVRYLYIKLLLCGSADVLVGSICLINDYLAGPGIISLITVCVFFLSIIAYGISINKALKKYVK